jgi:hypothetical protein
MISRLKSFRLEVQRVRKIREAEAEEQKQKAEQLAVASKPKPAGASLSLERRSDSASQLPMTPFGSSGKLRKFVEKKSASNGVPPPPGSVAGRIAAFVQHSASCGEVTRRPSMKLTRQVASTSHILHQYMRTRLHEKRKRAVCNSQSLSHLSVDRTGSTQLGTPTSYANNDCFSKTSSVDAVTRIPEQIVPNDEQSRLSQQQATSTTSTTQPIPRPPSSAQLPSASPKLKLIFPPQPKNQPFAPPKVLSTAVPGSRSPRRRFFKQAKSIAISSKNVSSTNTNVVRRATGLVTLLKFRN